jgi:phosphoenolpyruvate---glycerone phosphotransferase subunit DhaL
MSMVLNADDVRKILEILAKVFKERKDELNHLDTKVGDGDHGRSMDLGFTAVDALAKEKPELTIKQLLMDGGMQFNEAAGSTIGILMFSAMREAGKALGDKEEIGLVELKEMLDAAIKAIMKRGKSELGQRTILDSLHPALKVLDDGMNDSKADDAALVQSAIEAASLGAESTKEMKPTIGRAKWFVDRAHGEIDPGAVSGALIIKIVGEYLTKST